MFKDWSGSWNHAMCNLANPCPSIAAGKSGKALKFTGKNYLEVALSPSLENITENSYTWSAWYSPADFPVYDADDSHDRQAILCKPGFHTAITFASDKRFHFEIWNSAGQVFGASSLSTYGINQWHHLAATVDASAKTAAFYIDGLLQEKITYAGSLRDYGQGSLNIGVCLPPGSNHDWPANGLIDDVRVYSRAFLESEVKAVYNGKADLNPFTGKKDKYDCPVAGQTQGCEICRPLTMKWADDSTQCGKGQVCVDGSCITGTPPIPSAFDVIVSKSGNIATAKNKNGGIISSGTNYTQVIRAAIAATPDDGSLYIGPGTYDGLVADRQINVYYSVFPIESKNIHIYGAGIGQTILKLGNNQYYRSGSGDHVALIFDVTGYRFFGTSYSAFTLANMTLDGNKDNQTKFFADGGGLVLTGGYRSGGKFFNLELANSPCSAIYWGSGAGGNGGDYAGHWESYGYMHNIQTHDNFWEAITFDQVQKIRASDLKSENDALNNGTIGMGVNIIDAGDHDLDLIIDGLDIKNGKLMIGWPVYRGGGGITINNLKIDSTQRDATGDQSSSYPGLFIYYDAKFPFLVQNPKPITIGIDSIAGAARPGSLYSGGVYIKDANARVVINGGTVSDYTAFTAVNSSVDINGTRLKSANKSLAAQSSKINCTNCILEPTPGQYMYSSTGSGAQINFTNSFTTSMEKTDVSNGGKVTGSLSILKTVCNPGQISGCKVCKADGSAWLDDNSKCVTGQYCDAGVCKLSKGCVAKTCAGLGNYQCGDWSDGCGKTISCGACTIGKTCKDGQCVSSGSGDIGGGGGGGTFKSQKQMTREEILQKIAEVKKLLIQLIAELIVELQKQLAAMPKTN